MKEEHRLFAETARRFFAAELVPHQQRWRDQGIADRDFWNKAADLGLLGASVPEQYGGTGGGLSFDVVTLLEQARTGDTSWGFSVHNITTHYLLSYGTQEQKQRWLPDLVNGELVAGIAMSEPGAGSDLQALTTSAVLDGDAYVVNGSKTFISNGQSADLLLLVVKTDLGAGARGVSLLMVDARVQAGFRRGRKLKKIGLDGQDTSELFFDDARVPADHLLGGEEGKGFIQLMNQLAWERLMIGVIAVGASDRAIEETIAYTRQREAFGKRLMDFQNTRFKLAEAKTRLEVLRAYIDECVMRLEEGALDAPAASMAKWWGAETQNQIVDECLQLHGGYGYMSEYPIAQMFVDARVQKIYGGTNEIMKELIARSLDTQ
jgi:acyl-CoA dehydrogenase